MTQVLIDHATLELLVEALKTGLWNTRALAGWAPSEIDRDYNDDNDKINAALTAGRAALANEEPTKGPITNHIEMANKALRQAADHSYKIAMATRYARTLPKDTP